MIIIFSQEHQGHAPQHEFFRGERVPCFESPSRLEIVQEKLQQQGHDERLASVDSTSVLHQVHDPTYLDFINTAWQQWVDLDPAHATLQPFPSVWPIRSLRDDRVPTDFVARLGLYSMDNGTPIDVGTWQAAKAGADIAATAAKLVAGGARSVFCATRPPGHHAGYDFMGGYCFINNAAVAAQSLLNQGCNRVAILDVDYHHGNGTQSIFYDRSDVLFASIHGDPLTEFPFYLGHADETGSGAGEGYNLNLPLVAGTDAQTWFSALGTARERIAAFGADAMVVSLGLDTYEGDPISKFKLASKDFIKLGSCLEQIGLPTVIILEGGYATADLGLNTANVLEGFESV
ncbi:MAG: histone deacetylase family protein [Pseudomonadota bacterium]